MEMGVPAPPGMSDVDLQVLLAHSAPRALHVVARTHPNATALHAPTSPARAGYVVVCRGCGTRVAST